MAKYVRSPNAKIVPEHENDAIWRYQDLSQLLWTINSGRLWFARADTLGDPYEGSYTRAFRESLQSIPDPKIRDAVLQNLEKATRLGVICAAVNCWHASEYESAAMWNLHVKAGQGIAIRSTLGRLVAAFPSTSEPQETDHWVTLGEVEYIDHYRDVGVEIRKTSTGHSWNPARVFFLKRKSFEHEREVRALVYAPPVRDGFGPDVSPFPEGGVAVPADLNALIQAVYVSPGAPKWFVETVTRTLDRLGVSFPVQQSALDLDPIF